MCRPTNLQQLIEDDSSATCELFSILLRDFKNFERHSHFLNNKKSICPIAPELLDQPERPIEISLHRCALVW
jgi:hypothetical protein